jgi:aspartate-semialdehyde dehydrogenase
MMGSDFYFRAKIPVAILGATRKVGQKLVQLLAHHPWFEIITLCDSMNLVGETYEKVVPHLLSSLPQSIKNMTIQTCEAPLPCSLVFSALHPQEAFAIERNISEAGCFVLSCAPYELSSHVPLIVAELNSQQIIPLSGLQGGIVANPSSIVIGLTLALKPLMEAFGLEKVQAIAFPSTDTDHLLPNHEIEQQALMILGPTKEIVTQKASFQIEVKNQQVLEAEEDRATVSVKLERQVSVEEIIQVWRKFGSELQRSPLPPISFHVLSYLDQVQEFEQGALDKEMSVHLANLSPSSPLDYQFNLSFSHLVRGMAGSMLLNAELLVTQGKIYW